MFYRINTPSVSHELTDTEVFIINVKTGLYYVATCYGAEVWNALSKGYSIPEIENALTLSNAFSNTSEILSAYVKNLLEEELIFPSHESLDIKKTPLIINNMSVPAELILKKYSDLQEVIALDPIHDVSLNQGWPFQG